jgi:filamentous hemagglutinin family protein
MPTLLLSFVIPTASQAIAAAPITPSGLNTQVSGPIVTGSGPTQTTQYDITGGTRPEGGVNLFHSFGDFNVPNHNIANFLNDSGLATSNILGRVTGGNPSTIFGTIQTTGFGNANLFLMNPTGFLFGPHATVNVGGMVAFTSANYLRLEGAGGSGTFYADAAKGSILTSSPVAAFGFLGSNPGAIRVQGSQFSVTPGQSISLVGGNITIQSGTSDNGAAQSAKLSAPGGQINLASVASPGEILTGTLGQAPNINGQSFDALGTIQISQQSLIDVSGNGGGTVLIRGGQFVLDNSTISANTTGPGPVMGGAESIGRGIDIQVSQDAVIRNGAVLETNVLGNVTPSVTYGGVQVKADHIEIDGANLPFPSFTGSRSDVGTDIQPSINGGNSGSISLDANSILIKGGGSLETRVVGASPVALVPGKAGDITVTADQNLELNNSSIVSTIFIGSGSAGDITLTSRHGNIIESGNLLPPNFVPAPGVPFPSVTPNIIFNQSLLSSGKAGNLTLNAPEGNIQLAGALIVLSIIPPIPGVPVQEAGSGQVHINANNLQLTNFSTVQMDNFSATPVGNFNVTLNGNLTVNSSRIITTARGPAQAADLNITAHDVLVTQGSSLSTETVSSGHGGQLNIFADTLQVTNGGQISSGSNLDVDPFTGQPLIHSGTGTGGTINIRLAGPAASVLIDGMGSGIITNAEGTGAAGNTNITAQSVTIQNGGTISASTSGTASRATGGSISVNTTDGVTMTDDASITASSTGPGKAGNISIKSGQQFEMRDSSITTTAAKASGGNIDIQAVDRVRLVNSPISTTVHSGAGSGGNITIDPNVVVLLNSPITAQADRGAGGNITITTPLFLPDSSSPVSASSELGVNGTVTIQSPNAPASGHIQPLDKSPLQATSLLNQRCASLARGEFSSFTVAGRDSLPTEPGSWLASPLATLDAGMGLGAKAEGVRPVARGEGEPSLLSLRQIAPAGFLTQAFAVDWSASCQS